MPTRRLADLLLILVSGLIGLLLVEVGLRAVPAGMPEAVRYRVAQLDARQRGHARFIRADDEIGFLYRPDLQETIERADFHYVLTTDHAGFRNPLPWPLEPGIVVIGDSMTAGEGVMAEAAWPSQLADATGDSLVNLAVNGTSPPQMTRILERFGLALRPSLVVMAVFPANDYREAAAFQAWRRAGRPVPFAEWLYGPTPGAGPVSWLARALEGSRLRLVLHEAVRSLGAGGSARALTLADGGRVVLAGGAWQQAAELARGDSSGIEPVVAAILEARAMAMAAGARFLLVVIPSKEEVYAELAGVLQPEFAAPLLAALRGHAVPTVDLREALRRHARAGATLYFEMDGHLNAKGHQAVAKALLPWIRVMRSPGEPCRSAERR